VEKLQLQKSEELYAQAKDLIPGGVPGIRRPYNFVPGEYPIFVVSGKGGRITDVDGNEYIDLLCSYGPLILGHREEEVDKSSSSRSARKGFASTWSSPCRISWRSRCASSSPVPR